MPNYNPIFTSGADVSWTTTPITTVVTGTTAAAYNGTSASLLVFSANAGGAFVQKLVCEAYGTNTASVLRVFINNGSTSATAANNTLYYQYSLPVTTQSNVVGTAHIEIPLMIQLPAFYAIYVSIAAAANLASGWVVTAVGGEY
jgi:hypothetical protein